MKRKIRCRNCCYLDYDFISSRYENVKFDQHFCGLHGRTLIDINGYQINLNRHGSCGYRQKFIPIQLELF